MAEVRGNSVVQGINDETDRLSNTSLLHRSRSGQGASEKDEGGNDGELHIFGRGRSVEGIQKCYVGRICLCGDLGRVRCEELMSDAAVEGEYQGGLYRRSKRPGINLADIKTLLELARCKI